MRVCVRVCVRGPTIRDRATGRRASLPLDITVRLQDPAVLDCRLVVAHVVEALRENTLLLLMCERHVSD